MDFCDRQAALERARQGDSRALGELLDSFRPYVRKIAHEVREQHRCNTVEDSDLIQDSFLEVQRSFAGFRGTTVAEFVGWLRRIVLRSATRSVTGRPDPDNGAGAGERPMGEDAEIVADPGSSPSEQAVRREQEARITKALARLSEDMQAVIQARHVDGLSHAAIALRMGRSEGSVRVLYVRAICRLRELCVSDDGSSA